MVAKEQTIKQEHTNLNGKFILHTQNAKLAFAFDSRSLVERSQFAN